MDSLGKSNLYTWGFSEPQNDSSKETGLFACPGRLGRELKISKPIFWVPKTDLRVVLCAYLKTKSRPLARAC